MTCSIERCFPLKSSVLVRHLAIVSSAAAILSNGSVFVFIGLLHVSRWRSNRCLGSRQLLRGILDTCYLRTAGPDRPTRGRPAPGSRRAHSRAAAVAEAGQDVRP